VQHTVTYFHLYLQLKLTNAYRFFGCRYIYVCVRVFVYVFLAILVGKLMLEIGIVLAVDIMNTLLHLNL